MDFELQVEARDGSGRSGNRRLRRAGKVPAIVYGGGQDPRAIALDHNTLVHQMEHEAFFTSILTIKLGKESQPVVVKDVQRHPARQQVMHLDFQRIVADEAITLHVPIHFIGEDVARGVKEQGGVIDHLMTDAEVSCLPKDLPEYLELDVSDVELNQILHLSDIRLPDGVKLVALEHDSDQPILTIAPPRREEELEPTVEAEGAVPEEVPEPEAEGGEAESGD